MNGVNIIFLTPVKSFGYKRTFAKRKDDTGIRNIIEINMF